MINSKDLNVGDVVRHKKRGSTYEVVSTTARIQLSSQPLIEGVFADTEFVIYSSTLDASAYFVRPLEEFCDGRFEIVSRAKG